MIAQCALCVGSSHMLTTRAVDNLQMAILPKNEGRAVRLNGWSLGDS